MADISDVLNAIEAAVTTAVYPNGPAQSSPAGIGVKIYQGWPGPDELDADLLQTQAHPALAHVSIFPRADETRTTRFARVWYTLSVSPQTLTASISGNVLTIGGAPAPGLIVSLIVNRRASSYEVQLGDTIAMIAAALASQISAITPATASGGVITIIGAFAIIGQLGAPGVMAQEIRRQRRGIQVTCWCPNPAVRTTLASLVDLALAEIEFLSLADGSTARLLYASSPISDSAEKVNLYRRDLFYSAEYPTLQTAVSATITVPILNLTPSISNGAGGFTPIGTTLTTVTAP